MSLALDYRPRRFSDLVGQVPAAAVLYQYAYRRTAPPGLLLCGQRGSGKTSAARIFGAALNCAEEPGPASSWPCGTCPECKAVAANTSLNVVELDAASNGGVAQIRDIREQALYGTGGEYRLYILDEAHACTEAAFNAILKILEEPPPGVIFMLLTTEPTKIMPTVASRCHTFPFDPIPAALIRQRLEFICADRSIVVEPALLTAIAERARGAMRDAVMMLEQVSSVGITTLARWQVLLGETDFAPALIGAAAAGNMPVLFSELDKAMALTGDHGWVTGQLVLCMRDILVLTAGGTISASGGALAARQAVASQVTPVRAVAALRVLWDLQTRVRKEDQSLALQVAAAMLSDALRPVEEVSPMSPAIERATSIDQLRALVGGDAGKCG